MSKQNLDTFDADKCAYSSAAMGICGAVRDHHGSGGPILYHAFVPPKRTVATLVERLRSRAVPVSISGVEQSDSIFTEAADEIERLRAKITALREVSSGDDVNLDKLLDDVRGIIRE